MAFCCSVSQVLSMREIPNPFWDSRGACRYGDAAVLVPLKMLNKSLLRKRSRRLSTSVEKNSRKSQVSCSAGFTFPDTTSMENIPPEGSVAPSQIVMQREATMQQLDRAKVIACLRSCSPELALDAARAALDGGLTVVEVTMTTPSAAKVIEVLVKEYPSASIGAGTVLSTQDAHAAKDVGAKFLTSPVTMEDMVYAHQDGPVLYIPGAMTPTEVMSAYNWGAPAVKLYPVALVGGVRFVAALSTALAHIPLIASHAVTLDMVESYIIAGAMSVILSDAVFDKSAVERKDWGRIRLLAAAAAAKGACFTIE